MKPATNRPSYWSNQHKALLINIAVRVYRKFYGLVNDSSIIDELVNVGWIRLRHREPDKLRGCYDIIYKEMTKYMREKYGNRMTDYIHRKFGNDVKFVTLNLDETNLEVQDAPVDLDVYMYAHELLNSKFLTNRERDILNLYYIHSQTLDQISKKYKMTRERIRQIKDRAINLIRIKEEYCAVK